MRIALCNFSTTKMQRFDSLPNTREPRRAPYGFGYDKTPQKSRAGRTALNNSQPSCKLLIQKMQQ